MHRTWERCIAFDAHQRYRCVPSQEPTIGFLQKMFAHLIYNPMTDVTLHYEPAGGYDLADIIAEVEKGLEQDDDIIQQWFGADEVLKLLRSATTFDEMVDAVQCVCGGFEADPRLRAIVDRVLGENWDDADPGGAAGISDTSGGWGGCFACCALFGGLLLFGYGVFKLVIWLSTVIFG